MEEAIMKKGGHNNPPTTPRPGPPAAIRPKETIDQMRSRHKEEIKNLQDNCKHEKISGWMEQMWAPGHFSDSQVKVCEVCRKVVERSKDVIQFGETEVSPTGTPLIHDVADTRIIK